MSKLGYLSTYPPERCGIGEYLYSLLEELRVLYDGEIVIFTNKLSEHEKPRKDNNGLIVPSYKRGIPKYDELLENIKKYGPFKIFHIQHEWNIFPKSNEFLDFLNELQNYVKKVIITLHTVLHVANTKIRDIKEYHHELSWLIDVLIVHNPLQEFELWSQGLNVEKIHEIPHGTLINPYVGTKSKSELAKDLGVPIEDVDNTFILTMPGFLRVDKGLDVLLRAFQRVLARKKKVVLVVSGSYQGDKVAIEHVKSILESYFSKMMFTKNKYLSRDEMLKLMALSDLIVLPYRRDRGIYSVSGILHQALGSFKPIVGTKVPRLIEYYQLIPGLIVPPERDDLIAEKILYVMENYDKVLKLINSISWYVKRTSWKNVAKKHLNLYGKVLS